MDNKKFTPKPGQYYYQYWRKPCGNKMWRVWQYNENGSSTYIKDFQFYEKDKAVQEVKRLNGWA